MRVTGWLAYAICAFSAGVNVGGATNEADDEGDVDPGTELVGWAGFEVPHAAPARATASVTETSGRVQPGFIMDEVRATTVPLRTREYRAEDVDHQADRKRIADDRSNINTFRRWKIHFPSTPEEFLVGKGSTFLVGSRQISCAGPLAVEA